jgi:hypothetical protein
LPGSDVEPPRHQVTKTDIRSFGFDWSLGLSNWLLPLGVPPISASCLCVSPEKPFVPGSSFLVPRLRFPRASAGFMILAASMLPSALPAVVGRQAWSGVLGQAPQPEIARKCCGHVLRQAACFPFLRLPRHPNQA